MYAIGNIMQNAVFYSKNLITTNIEYLNDEIVIKVSDDGDGFPKDILDKYGEPYISKNKKGMGLGIFIAKNLIENLGGKILFYNSNENHAVVEIKLNNTILS